MENKVKYTAIPIEDYYLIVSNETLKIGDMKTETINSKQYILQVVDLIDILFGSKIIACNKECLLPLPLFDLPWFKNIKQLALKTFPDNSTPGWKDSFSPRERRGFIAGYCEAKEQYKYTEDDIRKALQYGFRKDWGDGDNNTEVVENWEREKNEYIKKLNQPRTYEVELEMEKVYIDTTPEYPTREHQQLKITNHKVTILQWKEIK